MARQKLMLAEKEKQKDLTGKVYIVTGANSGVGFETTKELIKQGAKVVMACRRLDAAREVAKAFDDLKGSYDIMACDLASLQSVREFVKSFLASYDRLDGLDCNAGMAYFSDKPRYTKDHLELMMSSSYFGHFLMVELLLDLLKKSAPSRIVLLSSVVHARDNIAIHLDDLNYHNGRPFNGTQAYGEAKLANVLYAKNLAKRLENTGVTVTSVHPGWARSNFGRGGSFWMDMAMTLLSPLTRFVSDSSWESAQTSLHCLLADDVVNHSGAYYSQYSVLYPNKKDRKGGWPMKSPNPQAQDSQLGDELVAKTREMVGLKTL